MTGKKNTFRKIILDKVDKEIIKSLMSDALTPHIDIAKKLRVSGGTIHVRLRKLESLGIIKGAALNIDAAKMGFELNAFIGIFLEKASLYNHVIKELSKLPEILEAHYTTGKYNILARVICRNPGHLKELLNENIQKIEGIASTESIISLEVGFCRPVDITA